MKRRQLLAGLLVSIGVQAIASLPALAATYVEQIVAQLRAQGFVQIEVETTWLGRARIEATRRDVTREIVLNPNTGEILRDLWLSSNGNAPTITIRSDDGAAPDDHGGDDGGGDNSGHGGGENDGGGGDGESGGGGGSGESGGGEGNHEGEHD